MARARRAGSLTSGVRLVALFLLLCVVVRDFRPAAKAARAARARRLLRPKAQPRRDQRERMPP